jgi:hypothetical protein
MSRGVAGPTFNAHPTCLIKNQGGWNSNPGDQHSLTAQTEARLLQIALAAALSSRLASRCSPHARHALFEVHLGKMHWLSIWSLSGCSKSWNDRYWLRSLRMCQTSRSPYPSMSS